MKEAQARQGERLEVANHSLSKRRQVHDRLVHANALQKCRDDGYCEDAAPEEGEEKINVVVL